MTQGKPEDLPESVVLGAFSGLKNTIARERLTGSDLERAVNIDLDDTGQPRRRRGYDRKITGSWHSVRDIEGKVYGVKDGMLGIVRPDYSFSALAGVGTLALSYAAVAEQVYYSGSAASGIITEDETVIGWGITDGQGVWHSPVTQPTETLGEVAGRLLGDPPRAQHIAAYKGRIYLAVGKVLWATELYTYHLVDRTRGFVQFEHDITLLIAMDDGLYVGTTGGLYFIKGVFGAFKLSTVVADPVLSGSGALVPVDLVHPNARTGPMPTGEAAIMMTTAGILAGFDGGSAYNLTHDRMVFPAGVSAAALFRQDQGVSSYVAAVDSAGGVSSTARIGDYVDAEIIRASQGG